MIMNVIELLATSVLWGVIAAITLAAVIITAHRKKWRLGKYILLLFMSILLILCTQVLITNLMENINLIYPPDGSRNEDALMLLAANFFIWPISISFVYSIIKATRKAAISWVKTNDVRNAYVLFGIDLCESFLLYLSCLKEGARRVRDLDFIESEEKEDSSEPDSEKAEVGYGNS